MIAAGIVLGILAIGYLFLIAGRRGHKGLAELRKWDYAHRGLHGNGVPENSMAAFRKALEAGYGIELDLHLLADGNLAVMHDSALKRTTGAEGKIEALTTEQLGNYRLQGTGETIPQFQQVLDLFDGKAPMIIELKSSGDNYAALAKTACKMLETYSGDYCIESFDPRCIRWLRENRPELIRGQLSQNFLRKEKYAVPFSLRFAMTTLISNFWTRPDFAAFRFDDRENLSLWLCKNLFRVQCVGWTIRSQEAYDRAKKLGWIPIFEGFRPLKDHSV